MTKLKTKNRNTIWYNEHNKQYVIKDVDHKIIDSVLDYDTAMKICLEHKLPKVRYKNKYDF